MSEVRAPVVAGCTVARSKLAGRTPPGHVATPFHPALPRARADASLERKRVRFRAARPLAGDSCDAFVRAHSRAGMVATRFIAVLDPATRRLTCVHGEHEAPVALRGMGRVERRAPTRPAVGTLARVAFAIGETSLAPGEAVVVFTEGATEVRSAGGALLGAIEATVAAHAGAAEQSDDITLLAVRRRAVTGGAR